VGLLFFGLTVMGEPLREFALTPGFQSMLVAFENPLLAILSGFVFTAIIQSSTAATGILVSLYLSGVDLNFTTAAYLILGISVGTTVTALIASLAGRRESKRLAIANTIYIATGCLLFGTLIYIFPGILQWFNNTWLDGARKIAMFYTFFKVGLTVLFLPFIGHLAALMYKIMPKRIYSTDTRELHYIKSTGDRSPAVIIGQSYAELNRMGKMVCGNLQLALDAFVNSDEEKVASVLETESSINYLNRQISSLLMQLEHVDSVADMKKIGTLMYIAADLERIGDHAENITENNVRTKEGDLRLSEKAMGELDTLSRATVTMVALMTELFDALTAETLEKIYHLERHIDDMAKEYTENHINRLKYEKNNPRGGVIFVNMVTSLERCADHANNIAYYLAEIKINDNVK
jgi:phosphate:Na+ symporter